MTITLEKPVSADTLVPVLAALTPKDREVLLNLGYRRVDSSSPEADLLSILKEHDIAVYRQGDVDVYKERMRRKAARHANLPFFWIFVQGLLGAAAATWVAMISGKSVTLTVVAVLGWVAAGLVTLVRIGIRVDNEGWGDARWESCVLANYSGQIPVQVLQKIALLSRVLPAPVAYVDSYGSRRVHDDRRFLIDDLKVSKRVFDPMLVVSHRGASYVIAVWDEPSFTAQPLH